MDSRRQLGEFLTTRRSQVRPADVGLAGYGDRRRVPGLRREELAVLAGVSSDYYTRVEQGRQANISAEVLDALARALRLDETEAAHLRDLAAPAGRPGPAAEAAQRPDPGLLRVMTALDHVPVLLLGHRSTVLARNALLRAVLGRPLEPGTSFAGYLFRDPLARERIVNWADFASAAVGAMRREIGRRPYDRRLRAEIDELRRTDPDVGRWWNDHTVVDYTSVRKHIAHSAAGPMTFDIEIIGAPHEPGQRLVVYTAQPDSPTARLLPILASWDAPPVRVDGRRSAG